MSDSDVDDETVLGIIDHSFELVFSKLPKKVYIFAFGTMHFLDRGSVIELLEKEGLEVERMK